MTATNKQAVVVGAHFGNRKWLKNCLQTLEGLKYPLVIVVNEGHLAPENWLKMLARRADDVFLIHRNSYSPGVLQAVLDHTEYDEILHLHDSVEIKDHEMFRLIFEDHAGKSVSLSHGYLMYMGKFLRPVLQSVGIPAVATKRLEHHNEFAWTKRYIEATGGNFIELWPSWTDGDVFVEKFGTKRMLLENDFIRKYKGTWDVSMIKD